MATKIIYFVSAYITSFPYNYRTLTIFWTSLSHFIYECVAYKCDSMDPTGANLTLILFSMICRYLHQHWATSYQHIKHFFSSNMFDKGVKCSMLLRGHRKRSLFNTFFKVHNLFFQKNDVVWASMRFKSPATRLFNSLLKRTWRKHQIL